jgi:hypothetical protein
MAKKHTKMLRVDADAHRLLRIAAAERGELISDLASRFIREGLIPFEAAQTEKMMAALVKAGLLKAAE